MLAFGDRPLEDSERAWLEREVRAAYRTKTAGRPAEGEPAVLVYEERLDDDVVRSLEAKRGPTSGNGWRGFYDLAAVDAALPEAEVLDAARFLADRSRRKVIVPLVFEGFGGRMRGREIEAGPRAPLADFWEHEAQKHEPLARDIRRALHERWGTARSEFPPPRGSA